jgi:hypothetical protein
MGFSARTRLHEDLLPLLPLRLRVFDLVLNPGEPERVPAEDVGRSVDRGFEVGPGEVRERAVDVDVGDYFVSPRLQWTNEATQCQPI